eukprot:TRINITY_DN10381_c0_g1_i1.p1 TRINITY_DN10381_c0_g1~~TRINITY_DN10381_c0_g1_i1.p1  ORF type:complete len:179 (-),score=32.77 TRINITY_DN10381_c0_g1_i1:145-681(-)
MNIYAGNNKQMHRARNYSKHVAFTSAARQMSGRSNTELEVRSSRNIKQTNANKRSQSCMKSSISKQDQFTHKNLLRRVDNNNYAIRNANKSQEISSYMKVTQNSLDRTKPSLALEQVNDLVMAKGNESLEDMHYCLVRFRQRLKGMLRRVEVKKEGKEEKGSLLSIVPLDEFYYENDH